MDIATVVDLFNCSQHLNYELDRNLQAIVGLQNLSDLR